MQSHSVPERLSQQTVTTLLIKQSTCKIRCIVRAWFGFFVVILGFVIITDALGFVVLGTALGTYLHRFLAPHPNSLELACSSCTRTDVPERALSK